MRARVATAVGIVVLSSVVAAASAAPPGRWDLVSGGGVESPVGEIGHARDTAGGLHVAWVQRTGGNSYNLMHTAIAPNGRIGATSPVVTGWAGLGGAAMYSDGSSLRLFFPGTRTTVTGDPSFGLDEAVSTTGGSTWLVNPVAVYRDQFAYARTASAVAGPDPDGLQAWYGLDGIGVHAGRNPSSPFRTGYGSRAAATTA